MQFIQSIQNTGLAVIQIMAIALIGFFLVKKKVVAEHGLGILSRLLVEVTLPAVIFSQLIREFSFSAYPNWWIFPLASALITLAGLILGALFTGFIAGVEQKRQFLSLVAFQNSGYLPMALFAGFLPAEIAGQMLVYLFLFLLGFNLIIWSFGLHLLSYRKQRRFELGSLFSPPVVATLFSLILIFFGANRFIPAFILKPAEMLGGCTVPLAMLVVGGNLAQVHFAKTDKKAIFLLLFAKMIILPLIGVLLLLKLKLPELIGMLIILELAVPSATSLSVIIRHAKKEDLLISQGIFFSHILGIVTIPLFLSLYFSLSVLR